MCARLCEMKSLNYLEINAIENWKPTYTAHMMTTLVYVDDRSTLNDLMKCRFLTYQKLLINVKIRALNNWIF